MHSLLESRKIQPIGQMMFSAKILISALLMLLMTGCYDINRAREQKLQISSTIQGLERKSDEYIFSDEIYAQIYGPNTQLGMEIDRLKSTLSSEQQEQFESSIQMLVLTQTVARVRMLDLLKTLNGKTAVEIVDVFNTKQAEEASRKASLASATKQ